MLSPARVMQLLSTPYFLLLIVTFLRLESACSSFSSHCAASLALAKGLTALLYDSCSPRLLGRPLYLVEILPLRKSKAKTCCLVFKTPYVAAPMRIIGDIIARTPPYVQLSTDAPTGTRLFLVHEWPVSEETCLINSWFLCILPTRKSTRESGPRKDYFMLLNSSRMSTFRVSSWILRSDVVSWAQTSRTPKNKMTVRKGCWAISPD